MFLSSGAEDSGTEDAVKRVKLNKSERLARSRVSQSRRIQFLAHRRKKTRKRARVTRGKL